MVTRREKARAAQGHEARRLRWVSKPMSARVDLSDREAVWKVLDEDERARAT